MKKIKIKLKNIENYEFEILESAEKGDYFSLKDWDVSDQASIIDYLSNARDDFGQNIKKQFNAEIKNNPYVVNLEKDHFSEIKDKESKIKELENIINSIKKETELEFKNKLSEAQLKWQEEKNKEIEKIKNESHSKIESMTAELNKKEQKIQSAELEKETIKVKQQAEYNDKLLNEKQKWQEEKNKEIQILIEQKNKEIKDKEEQLIKVEKERDEHKNKYLGFIERKSQGGTKTWGNDFEDDVFGILQETFGHLEDVEYHKTTKPINGQMPDFEVVFYDRNNSLEIGRIVIECKSLENQESSMKNEKFFPKLEQDRIRHKANFAILVTEVEPNSDFFIVNPRDYKNLYMIRPGVLAHLLKLFYLMAKKQNEEEKKLQTYKIKTEEKEKILKEFDNFKTKLLDTHLKNIKNNIKDIEDYLSKIIKAAEDAKDSARKIQNTHFENAYNLVEKFDIRKKVITPLIENGHFDDPSNIASLEEQDSNLLEIKNNEQ